MPYDGSDGHQLKYGIPKRIMWITGVKGDVIITSIDVRRLLDANENNIGMLLSNAQEVYRVPLYQRSYSWNASEWDDLFTDIVETSENSTHFLGSIVVVPGTPHRQGLNYFEIVDGQQRLATILIFLSVLRDLAKEKGIDGLAHHIDKFMFTSTYQGGASVKIHKLELGRLDDEAFRSILENTPRQDSHLTYRCYEYLRARVEELAQAKKVDLNSDYLEWALNKLLDRTLVIHINVLDYYNAFRLFEAMNDRGLDLSAADLIKNFLLMKVSEDEKIFNTLVAEWNEMYEKVREYEPVAFIRRYILSTVKGKISAQRLYESIRERVEKEKWTKNQVLDFGKNLNSNATIYRNLYEASLSSAEINGRLRDLQLVAVEPSYTLLLKVLTMHEAGILNADQVMDIMMMVENFHIRWGICNQSTSRLDTIYNQVCTDSGVLFDCIKETLGKEIKESVDDEMFRRNFESREFKGSQKRTKYILWELCKPTGETTMNISDVQTEHIMPVTLSDDWIEYLEDKTSLDKKEIMALHLENYTRIGNLTIIKGEWNSGMSNRLFSEKKEDYARSEFSITGQLTGYDQWAFEEIQKRSKELASAATDIWKWKY